MYSRSPENGNVLSETESQGLRKTKGFGPKSPETGRLWQRTVENSKKGWRGGGDEPRTLRRRLQDSCGFRTDVTDHEATNPRRAGGLERDAPSSL
jgi:hypothetical protein